MKKPTSPYVAVSIILLGAISASAQLIEAPSAITTERGKASSLESTESTSFASNKYLSGILQLPVVHKTEAEPSESAPVFVSQDAITLSPRSGTSRKVDSVLDLSVLQETSAYRDANKIKMKVSDTQASGILAGLAQISAAYQKPGEPSDSADCASVAMSLEQRVKLDSSKILEIVESEIAANPNCACEIVKTAIKASDASVSLVGDITEVAITASPESMRLISQCAIAAMPESLAAVQAVLAKLDPNSGDTSYSSKGSKSGKDAKAAIVSPPIEPPNPLDLPPPFPPLPPPQYPPYVTDPNP